MTRATSRCSHEHRSSTAARLCITAATCAAGCLNWLLCGWGFLIMASSLKLAPGGEASPAGHSPLARCEQAPWHDGSCTGGAIALASAFGSSVQHTRRRRQTHRAKQQVVDLALKLDMLMSPRSYHYLLLQGYHFRQTGNDKSS